MVRVSNLKYLSHSEIPPALEWILFINIFFSNNEFRATNNSNKIAEKKMTCKWVKWGCVIVVACYHQYTIWFDWFMSVSFLKSYCLDASLRKDSSVWTSAANLWKQFLVWPLPRNIKFAGKKAWSWLLNLRLYYSY